MLAESLNNTAFIRYSTPDQQKENNTLPRSITSNDEELTYHTLRRPALSQPGSSSSPSPISPDLFYSTEAPDLSNLENFNDWDDYLPRLDHDLGMQSETWLGGRFPSNTLGRVSAHNRESSLSSLGSTGPASPYNPNISNPHIAFTDTASDSFMQDQDPAWLFSVPQKPASQSLDGLYPNFQPYKHLESHVDVSHMRRRPERQGLFPTELATRSARSVNSVSSSTVGDESPATPSLGEMDDDGKRHTTASVPKLDRSMTDAYVDELYSPSFSIAPSQSQMIISSPPNEIFAQRLEAANHQHLTGFANQPMSATSRRGSPFRQESPLALGQVQEYDTGVSSRFLFAGPSPASRDQRQSSYQEVRGEAGIPQSQLAHISPSTESDTQQTISPKDSLLEVRDIDNDANFPLFPERRLEQYAEGVESFESTAQHPLKIFQGHADQGVGHYTYKTAPQHQTRHLQNALNQNSNPTRVRSTAEVPSYPSYSSAQKPAASAAEGGTYTCTYHGCVMRFETPALLQKHKREGHRQATAIGPSRKAETAAQNALHNTQAGPHRCDRINPGTGKPCNTVFSRPYDLTRHEDTIHNARKQKVRCDMCNEEKTFSRADALTRHYRVCHPDVAFPGKQRRRIAQA